MVAHQLIKANIPFKVIDNDHKGSSTKVAAGLINPITGRRYIKSWLIDDLLPAALKVYKEFEELLNIKIINEQNIIRTLKTPKQINLWSESSTRPGYQNYIQEKPNGSEYEEFLKLPCKFAEIKRAYRIDISKLITSYREYLSNQNLLINQSFDYQMIDNNNKKVAIYNHTFDHIIFCEGHQAVNNPFFNSKGFQLAKGEALKIQFPDFKPKKILRDEIFFVPDNDSIFWCGGGYQWRFESEEPTDTWKNEWVEKIKEITSKNYEIISHEAAIRPCVLDRKPLIGRHKSIDHLSIFNGLGTKGTSLGPYWANKFIEHLLNDNPLDPLVDINRYA
ncbi:MAG: FAD-binding oxidoreductase [Saprospiraceae bacterium]|nr:FAD-dependent oxidoreductase [Bacteroidia bacterium]NNE16388.1 FAD-binding oxidoreductase [Saprospiraceae bacterium]NNL93508.1 FAD-binding oxidoreductase [Saprospiraceae bacterium]